MSTKNPTQKEVGESSNEDPFTPVDPPKTLSKDDLLRMESPDAMVDAGVAMFAVASREGVLTLVEDGFQSEVTRVLYLSSDAEHAIERDYRRGLKSAPRACVAGEEQLFEAGPGARSRANQLSNHPEVGE